MKIIECKNLTKTYFRKTVLNNLSFTLEENKITGLIGRNGVGKTTLLKIISGFINETSGEIKVFSEKPFNSLNVSTNSIFIDDQMSFPPALQLYELLDEGGRFYPNWDKDLAKRLADYFSFDLKNYHHRLSKGKVSTFNAIIGIASRAPLTIFDEPTTGMDAAVRTDFYRALLKDYLAHPRTIIISSHHLEEIEDLLEDVLLIKDGHIHMHMPMDELKEWGIGLKGSSTAILELIAERKIVYEKWIGENTLYAVVKNDFIELELQNAKRAGVEITSVSPSDLCVYVTSETKGGIDDVFHNR
ncbi:ATP-binding cassette domain-containing protein [Bacillus sp. S/N-304-OC-R1]|uniref:ATP-binding cassette domain-containing protein n=1 Tax=Bacillus sp. S/N-304-OC-R1 TaxID=2758034 RepID=UPI001C8ED874|nr:ABC transporter ATP-binding protein [Bacillus sp. S/N-304-OC-R1]MBY0121258.1 ABC transporter ATP-binding protein [Bacillus sp. S/N-304-OC-R1]